MQLVMRFGEDGRARTAVASGRLDVAAATEFRLLLQGIRDVVGGAVTLDLVRVETVDDAGRCTLDTLVHECREHGGRVVLPAAPEGELTPAAGA
ncbi:hypothetical protein MF406_08740 [Georgenia sp. TF02-10]|uniref:STAS domain-containing protein n=1 Tax=Georgenia sp. TF02-10 TaxID=2917725 RepID=UPI001FA7FB96|nr:STAS domain-containing protein [Georgenia sp. TF02-10]UNX56263.1 hypothetical protein MF406_08740 [Georgenia sp. TF02-10]